jgi:hypothetical protein
MRGATADLRLLELCANEPAAPGFRDRSARAAALVLGAGETDAVAFAALAEAPEALGFAAVLRSAAGDRGATFGALPGDVFGVRGDGADAVAVGSGAGRARFALGLEFDRFGAAVASDAGRRGASAAATGSLVRAAGASAERSTRGTVVSARSAVMRGSSSVGEVRRGGPANSRGSSAVVGVCTGSATRRGNVAADDDCAKSSGRAGLCDGNAGRSSSVVVGASVARCGA